LDVQSTELLGNTRMWRGHPRSTPSYDVAVAIPGFLLGAHGTSQLVPSQSLGMEWSPTQAEQGYTIGLSQMAGFDSTDQDFNSA